MGCGRHPSPSCNGVSANQATDNRPLPRFPPSSQPLPIVRYYSTESQVQPLNPDEIANLCDRAVRSVNGERRVWFLAVTDSSPLRFRLLIYLDPDSSNGRLSRGRCVLLHDRGGERSTMRDYYYVASKGARTKPTVVPPVALMPFYGPNDRTVTADPHLDNDIIDAVDVARDVLSEKGVTGVPLYRLEFVNDHICQLYFGAPPDGGILVELVKEAGKYRKGDAWEGVWA